MEQRTSKRPPVWMFGILAVGALVASGIYVGSIRAWGATAERIIAAVAFGMVGAVFVGMVAALARASGQDHPSKACPPCNDEPNPSDV